MMLRPLAPFRIRPLRALTLKKSAVPGSVLDPTVRDEAWSTHALRKRVNPLLVATAIRDRTYHMRSLTRTIA